MPFFDGSRGRIHHTAWLPDGDVRAVVVFCHGGFGEHLGLYEALGRRLAADGIAVHALDAVGHGRSDGERDLMLSWDDYVDDARTLAGLAQAQHPGRPLVLMGTPVAAWPRCCWPSGPRSSRRPWWSPRRRPSRCPGSRL